MLDAWGFHTAPQVFVFTNCQRWQKSAGFQSQRRISFPIELGKRAASSHAAMLQQVRSTEVIHSFMPHVQTLCKVLCSLRHTASLPTGAARLPQPAIRTSAIMADAGSGMSQMPFQSPISGHTALCSTAVWPLCTCFLVLLVFWWLGTNWAGGGRIKEVPFFLCFVGPSCLCCLLHASLCPTSVLSCIAPFYLQPPVAVFLPAERRETSGLW